MSKRKVFQDSVVALPEQTGLTPNGLMLQAMPADHLDEKMSVLFSLSIDKAAQEELEERVQKGELVSQEDLHTKYAPNKADLDNLEKWLKSENFSIEQITNDGTAVYANAALADIEKSLQVKMVHVTRDGITYPAAQNAPSLPAEVGNSVHAIIGLQPFRHANKHFRKLNPVTANRVSLGDTEPVAQPQSTTVKNAPPYLVSEILGAYGAAGLNVTGKGQTIAILIDTFPNDADLQKFWQVNNLPTTLAQIQKINVNNVTLPVLEGEETLDAEWTSGIAPGANIRIYASGSLHFVDLDKALDRIIADIPANPGMRQLSISLGLGETFMGGPNGEVAVQHQKYLRLAASGVNVFVSSGDAGSNPDSSGHGTGPLQAEFAASDPFVTAVGGTSLVLQKTGGVNTETGWAGSGGGRSIFFTRQAWQTGKGVPTGNQRLVPDVSLAADPNEGALVILNGKTAQIGGTSWSAPAWAGFCALINEARSKAGKPALTFLNPLIYPLIGTPAFRDIVAGTNGAFSAQAGYDMVTGIGVPNVSELIKALGGLAGNEGLAQLSNIASPLFCDAFFSADDNMRHAIVGNASGQIFEVFFNPKTGIGKTLLTTQNGLVDIGAFYTDDDKFRHALTITGNGNIAEIFYSPKTGVSVAQLGNIPNAIKICGFYSADDGFRHAIVATSQGKVFEIFFGQKGKGQSQIGQFNNIVDIGCFYSPNDHFRHVIVGTADGNVTEIFFNPQKGTGNAVLANIPGFTRISAFYTSTNDPRNRRVQILTHDNTVTEIRYNPANGSVRSNLVNTGNTIDIGGFYSADDNMSHSIAILQSGDVKELYYAQ